MTLHTPIGSSWPSRLAYSAAMIFTCASASTNTLYGFSKGIDLPSSFVWAGVSLGASIVFALSWPALTKSLDCRQWGRAAVVAIALLITGAYSVSAALGSAMSGRVNAESVQTTAAKDRTRAQTAYDQAEKELAKLPATRSVAELQAILENARPVCRVQVTKGNRQTICGKPPALETELARAKSRDKHKASMDKASDELKGLGAGKVANSDAVALQAYLQGLGIEATADRINKLLVLLAVLVIECGGGLSLAIAMALTEKAASAQTVPAQDCQTSGVETADRHANTAQLTSVPTVHSPLNFARERLLAMVSNANGPLRTGHRALGEALGVSATRAGQLLKDLTRDGLIRVRASKTGSVVTLVPTLAGAANYLHRTLEQPLPGQHCSQ